MTQRNGPMLRGAPRPGFRLEITSHAPPEDALHVCGGVPSGGAACPNCTRTLFPVFRLQQADPRVSALGLWKSPTIEVLVCPACALYMKPYWIAYDDRGARIEGGERDDGVVLQEIETPYDSREVTLRPLEREDYPTDGVILHDLRARRRAPGVYHQLGGLPYRGGEPRLDCSGCGKPMRFAGIVDHDDLNVPLFEPVRRPVALIIGDGDCLHWFTCTDCSRIGVQWARG